MKSKIIFLVLFFITELYENPLIFSETPKINTPGQIVIKWINNQRVKHNLSPLRQSPLLQKTATKYAIKMATLNILSHTDPQGNRAINRYREMGGSALRIGEIIGAGSSLYLIEKAWLKSRIHRNVILDPNWTEIGVGYVRYRKNEVLFDVLFSENHIERLQIINRGEEILIKGNFDLRTRKKIFKPIMINGLSRIKVSSWEKAIGEFSFKIEKNQIEKNEIFIRLGYQDRDGNIIITNILENLHPIKKGDSQ